MSPTITCGFIPPASSASAPPSTPMSTGLKSRTYGSDDRKVALVARSARDDERVPLAEACLEGRELDAFGEQASLVAQVAQGVLGKAFERLRHPALLLVERLRELLGLERPAVGQAGAVAEDARAADADAARRR